MEEDEVMSLFIEPYAERWDTHVNRKPSSNLSLGDKVRFDCYSHNKSYKYSEVVETRTESTCSKVVFRHRYSTYKGGWDDITLADRKSWVYYSCDFQPTKNPCSEISISNNTTLKDEQMADNKLYEIKQGEVVTYGHKLAVNSSGLWVMEVKGSGAIITADKKDIEEVLPHTIGIRFESDKLTYHYFAEKDKFKVGDWFVLESYSGRSIVNVVSVDTKSKNATKDFTPVVKLVVEAV